MGAAAAAAATDGNDDDERGKEEEEIIKNKASVESLRSRESSPEQCSCVHTQQTARSGSALASDQVFEKYYERERLSFSGFLHLRSSGAWPSIATTESPAEGDVESRELKSHRKSRWRSVLSGAGISSK